MVKNLAPDRVITQRRQEEQVKRNYVSLIQRENKDKIFADWENTTHDRIQAKRQQDKVEALQQKHLQSLDERRERLATMLAKEQKDYEDALDQMVETQDQRRTRLAQCALELKEQREAKRKAEAEERLERAFRDQCDELRSAVSKNTVLQVAEDRREQILWNEEKKRQEREDNQIFSEMWEQERLKKIQRAQDDLERTKRMNEDLRRNLAIQKAAWEDAKRREKEIQAEEDRIMKEQIELAKQVELQKERQLRAERVAMGVRTKQFNETIRQEKAERQRQQKAEDMQVLNDLLQKIKQDEEKEQAQRIAERAEARRWMEAIREQMGQDAENQAELERLWQKETDKAWDKREAQWKAQQEARDRLMLQVFEERGLQLKLKRDILESRKQDQALERQKLLADMETLTQIDRERAAQKRQSAEMIRLELETQLALKAQQKDEAKKEKAVERAATAMAEEQFRHKVQQQLDAVMARRPASYRTSARGRPDTS
eukprot:RCo039509